MTNSAEGFRSLAPQQDGYGSMLFLIQQVLAKVRTATIVKVLAVTNDGGVTPVGKVDVQPLVQQVDGIGTLTDLQPVYGVPYMRIQGGENAVIIDPQVGDLGIALFGDRDLSVVTATKAKGAPGSARKHHLSDAMYLGGLLNGTPVQFVQFNATGITVKSPTKVTIEAPNIDANASTQFKVTSPDIQLDGAVHITGAQTNDSTIEATGDVTGAGTSLHTHIHSGVQGGSSNSGPPV